MTRSDDQAPWLPPDWEHRPFDLCGRYPKKSREEFLAALVEWTEFDGAEYELGLALGMWPPESTFQTDLKWIFWSDNAIGTFLMHGLDVLHHLGILEYDDEGQRWRRARTP